MGLIAITNYITISFALLLPFGINLTTTKEINQISNSHGLIFKSIFPTSKNSDNIAILKTPYPNNDLGPLEEFTFIIMFKLLSINPQPIFTSTNLSLWIDSLQNRKFGVLNFGKSFEYLFRLDFDIFPHTWIKLWILKKDSDKASHIRVLWDKKLILNVHERFTVKITQEMFNNFTLGGFIRKPKTMSKLRPFQGYVAMIMSFSLEINSTKVKNFYSIMDNENYKVKSLFSLNSLDSIRYIGKYVSWGLMDTASYGEANLLKPNAIKLRPSNFQVAFESCRYLKGMMIVERKNDTKYIWLPFSKWDLNKTRFNSHEYEYIKRYKWDEGEPNGLDLQNCIICGTVNLTCKDEYCHAKHPSICLISEYTPFILRGIPTHLLKEIDHLYFSKIIDEKVVFYGYDHTIIEENLDSTWVISSIFERNKHIAFNNESIVYPWGKNNWFFIKKSGSHVIHEKIQLKLTKCSKEQFSCNDGHCIKSKYVCNGYADCSNSEDEMDCSLVDAVEHRKEDPPFLSSTMSKTYVQLKFHLKSINKIQESKNSLDLSFHIFLKWKDSRISFNHLTKPLEYQLTDEENKKIWIPPVIFENLLGWNNKLTTNKLVQISALRDINETGKSNSVTNLHERLIYKGSNVTLILKATKIIKIHCAFDFQDYPFDTQTCTVQIGLSFHVKDKVAFTIGKDSITYDDIDHLQYEFTVLELKLVNSKGIVYIKMRRMFYNIIWTTYIPTFSLQIVVILTLFFPPSRFDITVMITITTTLVIHTLYQSVSTSLPATAYNKMIDCWLFFSLTMPFFVFIIEILPELHKPKIKKTKNIFKISIRLISKYGKFVIIAVTILFDVGYWFYNFPDGHHHIIRKLIEKGWPFSK